LGNVGDLVFVGTAEHGLHGNGKAGHFFTHAEPILRSYGISISKYESHALFAENIEKHPEGVVVLVYNEESRLDEPMMTEQLCEEKMERKLLIHPVKTARIVRDKRLTNLILDSHGVPVPAIIEGETTSKQVFSNAVLGSGHVVQAHKPGDTLDRGRYNTQYINTAHSYKGQDYFVSLRAICVGETCLSVYVRCRPTSEGSPSVHSMNTPVDADLLNYLHVNVALPAYDQIRQVSEKIGEVLGLGFYSHDLLPCSQTGKVYICETGFKFDEATLNAHLRAIKDKIIMADLFNGIEIMKTVHEFVRATRKKGFLL
jgi:hypothetical protein